MVGWPTSTRSAAVRARASGLAFDAYALFLCTACRDAGAAGELPMLDAVFKAFDQMFTPPFRTILFKASGLAITLLLLLVAVLFRLLQWLGGSGMDWLEGKFGPLAHIPLAAIGWIVAIALGLGLVAGAVLLMPAVTAVVASLFADD